MDVPNQATEAAEAALMPTFIRPVRVDVTQGGFPWELPALVAVGAAGVWAVVEFVAEWWPLLLAGAAATVAGTVVIGRFMLRRTVLAWPHRIAVPARAAQDLSEPPAALPAPPLALPAGRPAVQGVVVSDRERIVR